MYAQQFQHQGFLKEYSFLRRYYWRDDDAIGEKEKTSIQSQELRYFKKWIMGFAIGKELYCRG
jgi:hypothetical protein